MGFGGVSSPFSISGSINPFGKRKRKLGTTNKTDVYDRQDGKCARCKEHVKRGAAQIHHIKGFAKKGSDSSKNVKMLCANCHAEIHRQERAKEREKKIRKKEREEKRGSIGGFVNMPKRPFKF